MPSQIMPETPELQKLYFQQKLIAIQNDLQQIGCSIGTAWFDKTYLPCIDITAPLTRDTRAKILKIIHSSGSQCTNEQLILNAIAQLLGVIPERTFHTVGSIKKKFNEFGYGKRKSEQGIECITLKRLKISNKRKRVHPSHEPSRNTRSSNIYAKPHATLTITPSCTHPKESYPELTLHESSYDQDNNFNYPDFVDNSIYSANALSQTDNAGLVSNFFHSTSSYTSPTQYGVLGSESKRAKLSDENDFCESYQSKLPYLFPTMSIDSPFCPITCSPISRETPSPDDTISDIIDRSF